MKKIWQKLKKPSSKIPALGLLSVGAVITIVGVVAMNKTLDYFSTNEFCTSCHTMQQNYEEYKQSVHFKNASGVRADCADCHQPKDFIPKFGVKLVRRKTFITTSSPAKLIPLKSLKRSVLKWHKPFGIA